MARKLTLAQMVLFARDFLLPTGTLRRALLSEVNTQKSKKENAGISGNTVTANRENILSSYLSYVKVDDELMFRNSMKRM